MITGLGTDAKASVTMDALRQSSDETGPLTWPIPAPRSPRLAKGPSLGQS